MGAGGKQQPRVDGFDDIVIDCVASTWCIARYLFRLELGLSSTGMLNHMRTTNQLSWVLAVISGFQLQENQ